MTMLCASTHGSHIHPDLWVVVVALVPWFPSTETERFQVMDRSRRRENGMTSERSDDRGCRRRSERVCGRLRDRGSSDRVDEKANEQQYMSLASSCMHAVLTLSERRREFV